MAESKINKSPYYLDLGDCTSIENAWDKMPSDGATHIGRFFITYGWYQFIGFKISSQSGMMITQYQNSTDLQTLCVINGTKYTRTI